jgi:hypothetical protein
MRVTVAVETRGTTMISGTTAAKMTKRAAYKDTIWIQVTSDRARGGKCWEYPKHQLWTM